MTKNEFTQYLSTNPALTRIIENSNTRREKQGSNLLSTSPKEDRHTNISLTTKITESNNHYSLISNISGLNFLQKT